MLKKARRIRISNFGVWTRLSVHCSADSVINIDETQGLGSRNVAYANDADQTARYTDVQQPSNQRRVREFAACSLYDYSAIHAPVLGQSVVDVGRWSALVSSTCLSLTS